MIVYDFVSLNMLSDLMVLLFYYLCFIWFKLYIMSHHLEL